MKRRHFLILGFSISISALLYGLIRRFPINLTCLIHLPTDDQLGTTTPDEHPSGILPNATVQGGVLVLTSENYRAEIDPISLQVALYDTVSGLHSTISNPVFEEHEYQINENMILYPKKSLQVKFELSGTGLVVTIISGIAQEVTWPKIELPSDGNLILPQNEGAYIPLSDLDWVNYLVNSDWDTTESLSMPFWGIETRDQLLTYIVENPFHNTMLFDDQTDTVTLSLTHQFPPNPDLETPQRFFVYLDMPSTPIQSAIHFRKYLDANNAIVTLTDKIKIAPQIENLIGAPHAYIWGGDPITQYDVINGKWQSIAKICLT